ncbi:F-box protein [Pyrus ussuriensis x Pyrus communis]|uniref:F-box protein n=1 Tax=Pyrus ussuriensis x Pyrus communis TaxID=2448454 RepID=A0A5N5G4N4_9ROSA|nr:F-box protein [Pyrus ussuriensis x Pyrus communis]
MVNEEVLKRRFFLYWRGWILLLVWESASSGDKCLCAKRWPSTCKRPSPPTSTYCKLYQTFYKRHHRRTLLPPRLSFDNLEFFIDIWEEDRFLFSEMVPGRVLDRYQNPTTRSTLSVSVLVGRKDSNRVACIIDNSMFDYIDRKAYRATANDYIDFSAVTHSSLSGPGSLCFSWTTEMKELLMFLGSKWISWMLRTRRKRF